MNWSEVEDVALVLTLVFCFLAFTVSGHCQDSQWRVLPEPAPKPVSFWTMRNWEEPPLRTNKQSLRSPWYVVPQVLAVGATVANVTRSRKAGAGYGDASVGTVGVGVLAFVCDRYVWRPLGLGLAAGVIGIRGYGAATRTYR